MRHTLFVDEMLGPAAPALGWVPAPRYLLRRARIQSLMRGIPGKTLLEIGPGAGALLLEYSKLGFQCEALETSPEARQLASKVLATSDQPIPIHETPGSSWAGRFDVIYAFEVLEHIEDDTKALVEWTSWLKPGAYLLLSVPAHMRLWTARDEWAGHVRRYEREPLKALFDKAGLRVEKVECYGFPLTNLSEWASSPIFARAMRSGGRTPQDGRIRNTDRSGVDRSPDLKFFPWLNSFPGKLAIRTFCMIQNFFLDTDLGSGYVVKAQRK
jgi:SAM-dependent methyltransferase